MLSIHKTEILKKKTTFPACPVSWEIRGEMALGKVKGPLHESEVPKGGREQQMEAGGAPWQATELREVGLQ